MADLAFHRKYRPNTLKGYIGNEKLKTTALSALSKERRPQVVLLEGDSGCGKTTFARLLAKEYLCEDRSVSAGACNACMSCQQLDDYIQTGDTSVLMNVREIDIADQSGKRDIDTVLSEMLIPAYGDEWRVYIFDEVHMATPQAQNRMLKMAEEPPENILMIFCTTNPEMLLETLKNRCQLRLKVRKPTVSELGALLKHVCSVEGVDCDVKGVNFIATRADLTIRKALTSLEQVISEQGNAKYESAVAVFEEIADTLLINFYRKLIGTPVYDTSGKVVRDAFGSPKMNRDVLGYVKLLHDIRVKTDLKTFVNSLVDFTKKGIYTVNQVVVDGISDGELVTYRELFGDFTVEQMAYLIDKLLNLLNGYGDLETKLLMLGYSGIMNKPVNNSNQAPETQSLDSGLEVILNELTEEKSRGSSEMTAIKKAQEAEGIKLAEDMTRTPSIDEVTQLFGHVEVNF